MTQYAYQSADDVTIRSFSVFDKPSTQAAAINHMSMLCHNNSVNAGWWEEQRSIVVNGETFDWSHNLKTDHNAIGTKFALIHSEVSEAMEGYRKGVNDDHLVERAMVEVELADALIRIFDLAGALDLDVGGALVEKLEYNKQRADHKAAARAGAGGKKF